MLKYMLLVDSDFCSIGHYKLMVWSGLMIEHPPVITKQIGDNFIKDIYIYKYKCKHNEI